MHDRVPTETVVVSRKASDVEVETESEFTIGETVVDFWGVTAREPNVEWIYTAEADGFYDLLTERLSEFG